MPPARPRPCAPRWRSCTGPRRPAWRGQGRGKNDLPPPPAARPLPEGRARGPWRPRGRPEERPARRPPQSPPRRFQGRAGRNRRGTRSPPSSMGSRDRSCRHRRHRHLSRSRRWKCHYGRRGDQRCRRPPFPRRRPIRAGGSAPAARGRTRPRRPQPGGEPRRRVINHVHHRLSMILIKSTLLDQIGPLWESQAYIIMQQLLNRP